ncbi:hypothetical protein UUU_26020 (plasmid) [Klebsiella pneumoniae subsp. pneumoniae DSM 30104 = JCM 1662 = NBRC 14940]|nr:hypothetical protein UUU_26020 [Klebsiella pneumoniae subsp. pneumoniae DSM 30104 = JCM 1662 = NBRC 14940]
MLNYASMKRKNGRRKTTKRWKLLIVFTMNMVVSAMSTGHFKKCSSLIPHRRSNRPAIR